MKTLETAIIDKTKNIEEIQTPQDFEKYFRWLRIQIQAKLPDQDIFSVNPQWKIPINRWNELSAQQKWNAGVKSLKNNLEVTTLKDYLTLYFLDKEISPETIATIQRILECTKTLDQLQNLPQTIDFLADKLAKNELIKIYISQCIGKNPELRQKKMSLSFPQIETSKSELNSCLTEVEQKGWETSAALLEAGDLVEIIFLLGDMDLYNLDQATQILSENEIQLAESETSEMAKKMEQECKKFFGENANRVQVQRWSELYEANLDFKTLEKKAKNNTAWQTEKFMNQSVAPYFRHWGYTEICDELGISKDAMTKFITQDVIRTAAQYRLEASIIKKKDGLQAWAESVSNPQWPQKISNYDNSGLPPTLNLL